MTCCECVPHGSRLLLGPIWRTVGLEGLPGYPPERRESPQLLGWDVERKDSEHNLSVQIIAMAQDITELGFRFVGKFSHVEQDGCSIRLFLQEGTDPKYTVARCPSHCPRHPYQILTFPDIQNRIHQERRAACPFENHAYRNLVAL